MLYASSSPCHFEAAAHLEDLTRGSPPRTLHSPYSWTRRLLSLTSTPGGMSTLRCSVIFNIADTEDYACDAVDCAVDIVRAAEPLKLAARLGVLEEL
jgi:hypothetical protein